MQTKHVYETKRVAGARRERQFFSVFTQILFKILEYDQKSLSLIPTIIKSSIGLLQTLAESVDWALLS